MHGGQHKVWCSTGLKLTIIKNLVPIFLKLFPKNFKLLYAFAGKHCCFDQQKMTCNNIFSHEGLDFGRWLEGLLAVLKRLLTGRKKRHRSSA
jgi:hypothetical protein